MSVGITNAARATRAYRDNQKDIWEETKREHDCAMLAFEIEELVALGIAVLGSWLKCLDQWHHWVSEDAQNYSAKEHSLIKSIEDLAAKATKGTLKLIDDAKKLGHDIDHEETFRLIADEVLASSTPSNQDLLDWAAKPENQPPESWWNDTTNPFVPQGD